MPRSLAPLALLGIALALPARALAQATERRAAAPGQEVTLELGDSEDLERLVVTAPAGGVLRVEVLEASGDRSLWLRWSTPEGQPAGSGDSDLLVQAGERWGLDVAVRSTPDGAAWPARVRLVVAFTPQPFPGEPNDTPESAQLLEPGAEVSIAFLHRGDHDYLALVAPGDGVLTLDVLEKPAVHEVHRWWISPAGEVVRSRESDVTVRAGERWVLGLRSADWQSRSVASPEPVRLRVRFTPQPFPGEPNDTPDTAQPLEPDAEVSLAFLHRNDHDYFELVAPEDGVFTLEVLEKPDVHEVHRWWISPAGEAVRGGETDVPTRAGERWVLGLRSADWQSRSVASPEPVRLRVRFTPQPFPGEPNDTPDTAQPLEPDAEVSLAFLHRNDHDYFGLVAPGDGVFTLEVLEKPDVHEVHRWWISPAGEAVRGGETDVPVRAGERWVLGLRSAHSQNRSVASPAPVRLRVRFTPEPFPGEPDDTPETAQPLEPGQEVSVALLYRNDHDHFAVVAPDDGVLRVAWLERPEVHEPFLWWIAPDGRHRRPNLPDVAVRAGERWVLALRSARFQPDSVASPAPLRLRLDFTAQPFPGEPDDTPQSARPLELGQEVAFALLHGGDRDHFVVVAPEDGLLRAELRSEGALAAPFLSWFGPDGTLARQGSTEVPVQAGERWVIGARSRRDESEHLPSPGPHWLRVVFELSRDPQEPNDTPEQATPLAPGDALELTFTPSGDPDWFRVVGRGDAVLRLELGGLPGGRRPWLRWRDEGGEVLGAGEELWVADGQTVWLELRSAGTRRSETAWREPFTLRLVASPTADPFEPNDAPDAAADLALGRRALGELVARDVDWFRVRAPAAAALRLQLEGPEAVAQWVGPSGRPREEAELALRAGEVALLRVVPKAERGADAEPARYALRVIEVGGDPRQEAGAYPRQPPPLRLLRRPADLAD